MMAESRLLKCVGTRITVPLVARLRSFSTGPATMSLSLESAEMRVEESRENASQNLTGQPVQVGIEIADHLVCIARHDILQHFLVHFVGSGFLHLPRVGLQQFLFYLIPEFAVIFRIHFPGFAFDADALQIKRALQLVAQLQQTRVLFVKFKYRFSDGFLKNFISFLRYQVDRPVFNSGYDRFEHRFLFSI